MKVSSKKFGGKYVATKSFTDTEVIASGTDLIKVYNRAVKKGVKDPVINYILKKGVSYCPNVFKI